MGYKYNPKPKTVTINRALDAAHVLQQAVMFEPRTLVDSATQVLAVAQRYL